MDDDAQEICRLGSDQQTIEHLPDGMFTFIEIDVYCSGDAQVVLDRTKSLLGIVLRYSLEHPANEQLDPDDEFAIDKPYWASVLPSWFLEKTPFDSSATFVQDQVTPNEGATPGEWSVEGWLYWFLDGNEGRHWRWWSASVDSATRITVVLATSGLPFPWEALRWALLAAGATSAGF